MASYLELNGVSKKYGDKAILRDLNAAFDEGDLVAIVGPSGVGKTTLLRIIDRLEEPDSGEVSFRGEPYSRLSAKAVRKRIGMVFQNPVLFNASVFNNVAYSLRFRGVASEELKKRVLSMLRMLKLDSLSERSALTLSGGEAQRVSLARAMVYTPELLLLDEPTANLDPHNVSIIEDALMACNRENRTTTIIVTHNIFQAKRIAKKVAFLLDGELIEYSAAEEFFSSPKDPRTASFIKGDMVY
ncbi:MAG TPA: phosphate ABC transporter ATP-binding protein [Candidatus Methanomethylicus sp.]|nr:phosphate ABC transporter ATP-binding protein [Candidatus Methanomethylicus sp.]HRR54637.1 phosphate ABC transporter ATP-binding protein [Candidatus Methanomethylicus sp.]